MTGPSINDVTRRGEWGPKCVTMCDEGMGWLICDVTNVTSKYIIANAENAENV